MVPHLRPGCPFRDIATVREAATWCDELGRWRLPDVSPRIPLPPAPVAQRDLPRSSGTSSKADLNNNNNNGSNDEDESNWDNDDEENDRKVIRNKKGWDIVDAYFRRSRMDTLLAHAREAKTFGEYIQYHNA